MNRFEIELLFSEGLRNLPIGGGEDEKV